MEFQQQKLRRIEWESIEKQVDEKEKNIIKLIKHGMDDVQNKFYNYNVINCIVHLEHESKDYYIYIVLLKEMVDTIIKTYGFSQIVLVVPKKKLNGADQIRLENQKKKLTENIEYTMLNILQQFFKELASLKKKKEFYFYNICYLYNTYKHILNSYFALFIKQFIDKYNNSMNILWFIENTETFIESNSIFDYKPIELFEHQKTIFDVLKNVEKNDSTLIYYRAPTSSGKTFTPLGICKKFKVIFMCASRHISVGLGKNAVNAGIRTAFAFGCETIADVRLHFSSVNSYIKDKHPKKPDHSDGIKVDLMICDIQSYEIAMLYMTSFFDNDSIVLFFDEPTITMDYESHDLHDNISNIWKVNTLKHIILSSATLPNEVDMTQMIEKFKSSYSNAKVHYIETMDEYTNIKLLDLEGKVIMPHNIFKTHSEIIEFIALYGKTHFKFLSVTECAIFILYICKNVFNNEPMIIEHFKQIDTLTSYSIRQYYYIILQKIKPMDYTFIIESYNNYRSMKLYDVGIDIMTKHSYTLTYGPTIFLCKDIEKWVDYYVQNSGIHHSLHDELEKTIDYNNSLNTVILKKRKLVEDKTVKDEGHENKLKDQRFDPETKQLIKDIELIERSLKRVQLNNVYIPNTREHFAHWTSKKYDTSNSFTSVVDESYVRKIMKLSVDTKYKILLLIGVGVFNPHESMNEYNDIMKELADTKQLIIIIASEDYIYGTNYQFCHAYLSEELNVKQEKIIQAIGRVGRKEKNKTFTFRFKNSESINTLFIKNSNLETINMNNLFFTKKI